MSQKQKKQSDHREKRSRSRSKPSKLKPVFISDASQSQASVPKKTHALARQIKHARVKQEEQEKQHIQRQRQRQQGPFFQALNRLTRTEINPLSPPSASVLPPPEKPIAVEDIPFFQSLYHQTPPKQPQRDITPLKPKNPVNKQKKIDKPLKQRPSEKEKQSSKINKQPKQKLLKKQKVSQISEPLRQKPPEPLRQKPPKKVKNAPPRGKQSEQKPAKKQKTIKAYTQSVAPQKIPKKKTIKKKQNDDIKDPTGSVVPQNTNTQKHSQWRQLPEWKQYHERFKEISAHSKEFLQQLKIWEQRDKARRKKSKWPRQINDEDVQALLEKRGEHLDQGQKQGQGADQDGEPVEDSSLGDFIQPDPHQERFLQSQLWQSIKNAENVERQRAAAIKNWSQLSRAQLAIRMRQPPKQVEEKRQMPLPVYRLPLKPPPVIKKYDMILSRKIRGQQAQLPPKPVKQLSQLHKTAVILPPPPLRVILKQLQERRKTQTANSQQHVIQRRDTVNTRQRIPTEAQTQTKPKIGKTKKVVKQKDSIVSQSQRLAEAKKAERLKQRQAAKAQRQRIAAEKYQKLSFQQKIKADIWRHMNAQDDQQVQYQVYRPFQPIPSGPVPPPPPILSFQVLPQILPQNQPFNPISEVNLSGFPPLPITSFHPTFNIAPSLPPGMSFIPPIPAYPTVQYQSIPVDRISVIQHPLIQPQVYPHFQQRHIQLHQQQPPVQSIQGGVQPVNISTNKSVKRQKRFLSQEQQELNVSAIPKRRKMPSSSKPLPIQQQQLLQIGLNSARLSSTKSLLRKKDNSLQPAPPRLYTASQIKLIRPSQMRAAQSPYHLGKIRAQLKSKPKPKRDGQNSDSQEERKRQKQVQKRNNQSIINKRKKDQKIQKERTFQRKQVEQLKRHIQSTQRRRHPQRTQAQVTPLVFNGRYDIVYNQRDNTSWIGEYVTRQDHHYFTNRCVKCATPFVRNISRAYRQLIQHQRPRGVNKVTVQVQGTRIILIRDYYKGDQYHSMRMLTYDQRTEKSYISKNGFNLTPIQMQTLMGRLQQQVFASM